MKHRVLSTTGSTRGTAYTMSNKVLTHEGTTYVAWLDQIHKTYIRTGDRKSDTWSDPVFVGDGDDNHGGPALVIDSENYLHLVFGPHHNPLQHAISAAPLDASRWVIQPAFGGVGATYPSLVCDAEDTLHACYRGSVNRERPWGLFYQRRPKNSAWSAPVKLFHPEGPPAYTQFTNALHLAQDGTLFLAFHIVRATEADPGQVRGMGFGVMRSRDGGRSWETLSGEPLGLPATPNAPCVIEFHESLDVRMGNLACDEAGAPCFTLNRREGGIAHTDLYRWRNKQWEAIPLLPEAEKLYGACAISDACSLSISNDGALYAAAPVCERPGGWAHPTNEIVLFTSRDGGDTFRGYRVSPEDPRTPSWLPSLERPTGHNRVASPLLIYTHGEKGEGCSPDIHTEIRAVSLRAVTEAEDRETEHAIAQTAALTGLLFTEEQYKTMRPTVERRKRHYRQLREIPVGYDIEPPTAFLPGPAPPRGEQKPFALSPAAPAERPDDEALAFLPLTALARLIERREISPVELTRVYLDRLTHYGPKLHCVVTLTEDLALEQARAAEAEILRGNYRGPLHGIPWGAKDLLATRGIPTTWGATPFKERIPHTDATVVTRLREAGAVLAGKLSTGALASGPHWFGGMTRNPWNLEAPSSGSSAGPGSATAAGLVGFSIGSETHGSIVSPSHTCGTVGLRPTYGRVSRHGAMALSWTLDKLGPMCRGVEDCAAVLSAIFGPDGHDHSVADAPFNWPPGEDLSSLRIGYLADEFNAVKNPDERALYDTALAVLKSLGLSPQPTALPNCPYDALMMILIAEAAAAFDDPTRAGELDTMAEADNSRWPANFRAARPITAVEYLRAQRVRGLLLREMAGWMARWDAVVIPGTGRASLSAANLSGYPAVILPCGFVDQTPRGLSFIGRPYEEATILTVARAYEQATDWHRRHPKLA